ncbi:hypothetical protein [Halorussus amylolyticus]|uniref:hypothetical protein n=1 Tax=Halorussus amylolyticus TaxID=1126242 RepID=UPI00104B1622|nr:hypothetical protein [Halorussus amylolyticus]
MADPEIARRLRYIHQTLELIALLLAVLLVQQGGIGVIVGVGAAVVLVVNAVSRLLGWTGGKSTVE